MAFLLFFCNPSSSSFLHSYEKRLSAILNFWEGHPCVHLLVIKTLSKAYWILLLLVHKLMPEALSLTFGERAKLLKMSQLNKTYKVVSIKLKISLCKYLMMSCINESWMLNNGLEKKGRKSTTFNELDDVFADSRTFFKQPCVGDGSQKKMMRFKCQHDVWLIFDGEGGSRMRKESWADDWWHPRNLSVFRLCNLVIGMRRFVMICNN